MTYDDYKLATPPYESDEQSRIRDPHFEQERCEVCQEWFDWDVLINGICPECISEINQCKE